MYNFISPKRIRIAVLSASALLLAGCYVAPLHPTPYPTHYPSPVVIAPTPVEVKVVARLYPANDEASATGVLQGLVTNNLQGKGFFTLFAHGEQLSGEATRQANSKRGVASASGSRGTRVQCAYEMTNASQGSGHCNFSNGAQYTLHLGG